MLCYCNYISHLHFKQKIKVTTSFIWLRIRMDTMPLSLQWVASLRQIVLAITSGALNEIHGAGTVVWFVLWKAPGWEQVNYAYTSSYIYMYVYMSMYICIYVCIYIHMYIHVGRTILICNIRIHHVHHVCVHTYMYMHMYVNVYMCIRVYVCIKVLYVYTRIRLYGYMCICAYVYI